MTSERRDDHCNKALLASLACAALKGVIWPHAAFGHGYTPLSESRSALGGLLEVLGPILGVLAIMASTN